MSSKTFYRLLEESQLNLEEKWLVEALAEIKQQRNCLQIERLHLESLKTMIKQEAEKAGKSTQTDGDINLPSSSGINTNPPYRSSRKSLQFEDSLVDTETACNDEELDLAISKSIFGQAEDYNMEEYDEEDVNAENMVIDINMLMNGTIENDPS